MKKHFLIVTLLIALTLVACDSASTPTTPTSPTIPEAIATPEGQELFWSVFAEGVQIYTCQAKDAAFAWTFVAPEATLHNKTTNELLGTHGAGPFWAANDGSKVTGTKLSEAPSPNANSIPLLLLQTTPDGTSPTGLVTPTVYIQRLETVGGVAPTSGCDASSVNQESQVPYTALYYFYKAN
jgi:hypothetical protein